ncbi:MAG: leucine-rich repeat domain-containing protein [Bacteroidota bacterium]|nr:leucine-rich repeat domain-containing protein [Bacteroidota bacterium]
MKRKILLSLCFLSFILSFAQGSTTLNVPTAGTLTTLLSSTDKTTITDLTVTGNIDARDLKCLRDEVTNLSTLDLSSATIRAYTGTGGTSDPNSTVSYPANEMPQNSFSFYGTNAGKTTLTALKLPNTIVTVGVRALNNCSGLTGITIPNLVTSIASNAFYSCTGLTSLTLGNSVISIGNSAFLGCSGLSSLAISDAVTTIGTQAFYHCNGLTTVIIGISVTNIGDNAFLNCSALKSLTVPRAVPPTIYANTFSGVNKTTCKLYLPTGSTAAYQADAYWSSFSSLSESAAANSFSITVQSGTNGSVQINNAAVASGSLLMVNSGDTKSFTILPVPGYEVATLTYNDADVKSNLTNNVFTTPAVTTNSTLNVTFQKSVYNLSIISAETGTVNQLCSYGDTPSFSFTPVTGWKVSTILYNDVDVTSSLINGIFKVPAISANARLAVSFISTNNTVTNAPAVINSRVKVYARTSEIIVEGTEKGESVELYSVTGSRLQTVNSPGDKMSIPVESGKIYMVKTGTGTFKVIL